MPSLSQQVDRLLINKAWSLWTELGVAGVKRQHQQFFISLEELIILTAMLSDVDARLRDEALDWCSRHHDFISISRLKTLLKAFSPFIDTDYSQFAATLNSVSQAQWPLLTPAHPLKFTPSKKSKVPQCELPALLGLRLRALFGTGARADLITFFFTEENKDFSVSDTTEIGYGKRSLFPILDRLVQSGLFKAFNVRNQRHFRFSKQDQFRKELGLFPEFIHPWRSLLEVIFPLRQCIRQVETKSLGIKVTEIRNVLIELERPLQRLQWSPPPLQNDLNAYWKSLSEWILAKIEHLEYPAQKN